MIKPAIGRVVWYWTTRPLSPEEQPMASIVTFVHSDTMVNLTVFDYNGNPSGQTSVFLYQGEGEKPEVERFCEWMPYQLGQAAKTEEALSK